MIPYQRAERDTSIRGEGMTFNEIREALQALHDRLEELGRHL
jgi:hypothetical protein